MGAKTVKGITVEINGKATGLGEVLKEAASKSIKLNKELKAVNQALKLDPTNTILLAQKQSILADSVDAARKELEQLEDVQDQVEKQFANKEIDRGAYLEFQNRVLIARKRLKNLEEQADETAAEIKKIDENSVEDVAEAADQAEESLKDAGKQATVFGDALKAGSIIEAAKGIAGAVSDIVEETNEYRKIMGTLEVSSEAAGYTADETQEAYKRLYGVLGNEQAAATTLANLQALQLPQAELSRLIDNTTGAWAKYGDSIPIDGLAESVNETIRAGQVTGTFADVINWGSKEGETFGVMLKENIEFTKLSEKQLEKLSDTQRSEYEATKTQYEAIEDWNKRVTEATSAEDYFNMALEACSDESEKANLVMQAMQDQGLGPLADAWRETNDDIVAANETQADFSDKTAEMAERVAPVVNEVKEGVNELAGALLEATEGASLMEAVGAVLSQAMQGLTDVVHTVADAWNSLDDGQQQTIVKLAGIAAAAVPVIAIGGKAVSGIGSLVKTGSGLIGMFGGLVGKLGGLAHGAGNAVEKVSSLGAAAGSVSAPVSSAGGAVGTLSKNALGLVAAGAGILLASAGLALLAQSAIQIASAGPGAAVALVGMIAAVTGMAVGAAALAPALAAGAAGLVAFGAGVALVGAGVLLATSGVTLLATQLPNIASNGASAAAAFAQIGASLVVLATGATLAAAAVTVILVPFAGAAVTIAATDIALIGLAATFTLAAVGAAALGVAMLAVSGSVASINKDAVSAGTALSDMVSGIDIVKMSLDGLGGLASGAVKMFAQAFTAEQQSAAAAAQAMTSAIMQSILLNTDVGMLAVEKSWTTSLSRLDVSSRLLMTRIDSTMKASLEKIVRTFANTTLAFNQSIELPHFSLSGEFDPETGSVPTVSVSWYRKGGILRGAQIFGALGGDFLGGGEGGPEAVLPLRSFYDELANILDRKLSSGSGVPQFTQYNTYNSPKDLSPAECARQTRNETRKLLAAVKRT